MTYCGFFNAFFVPFSSCRVVIVSEFFISFYAANSHVYKTKRKWENSNFPFNAISDNSPTGKLKRHSQIKFYLFRSFQRALASLMIQRREQQQNEEEKEKHFQFHIHSIADSICVVCSCSRNNSILYYFLYPISSSSIRHFWCCCVATIHLKMKNLISKTPEINLQHGECPRCSGEEIIMKMK